MKLPKIPGHEERLLIKTVLANAAVFTQGDELFPGTLDRLQAIQAKGAEVVLFSTHPHPKISAVLKRANIKFLNIAADDQPRRAKLRILKSYDPKHCTVIGNCLSDGLILGYEGNAALRFAVICQLGLSPSAMKDANAVFTNGCDALDALLHPQRLIELLGH